jgi:hypothetical protein
MLNLFIGVVIIEMEACMRELRTENDIASRAKALAKKEKYSKKVTRLSVCLDVCVFVVV